VSQASTRRGRILFSVSTTMGLSVAKHWLQNTYASGDGDSRYRNEAADGGEVGPTFVSEVVRREPPRCVLQAGHLIEASSGVDIPKTDMRIRTGNREGEVSFLFGKTRGIPCRYKGREKLGGGLVKSTTKDRDRLRKKIGGKDCFCLLLIAG